MLLGLLAALGAAGMTQIVREVARRRTWRRFVEDGSAGGDSRLADTAEAAALLAAAPPDDRRLASRVLFWRRPHRNREDPPIYTRTWFR